LGSTLILLRLSDAIAELEGIEGAQIHRSGWVARHAVLGQKKGGAGMTLVLRGGVEAPVSRPNRKAVRDSGWLAT
jgi:DNA-binding LytR/AlgR family response regulator